MHYFVSKERTNFSTCENQDFLWVRHRDFYVSPLNCREKRISEYIAQKMKFFIKDFLIKCDQSPRKLWIWSHLQKKSLMESFIFCAVKIFATDI